MSERRLAGTASGGGENAPLDGGGRDGGPVQAGEGIQRAGAGGENRSGGGEGRGAEPQKTLTDDGLMSFK